VTTVSIKAASCIKRNKSTNKKWAEKPIPPNRTVSCNAVLPQKRRDYNRAISVGAHAMDAWMPGQCFRLKNGGRA
jgi:hypothetical protein